MFTVKLVVIGLYISIGIILTSLVIGTIYGIILMVKYKNEEEEETIKDFIEIEKEMKAKNKK